MQTTSVGDALFTKTQQKVLGLIFRQPEKSFYTNEIMRRVDMGRGTVSRELERLASAGILKVSREGNQKHYQADSGSPVFKELTQIIRKSICNTDEIKDGLMYDKDYIFIAGIQTVSRIALRKLARSYHIRRLELFGSAARGELEVDSDIDLLVEFENGKSPSLGGMVKLQAELSVLFGERKVDLATRSILNNPYRRQAIMKNLEELYAA